MSYGGSYSRSSSSSSSHGPSPSSAMPPSSTPGAAAPPLSSSSLFARPLPSHHRRPLLSTPASQRHSDAVEQSTGLSQPTSSNGSTSTPASQPAAPATRLPVSPDGNEEARQQQQQQQAQRRYYPHHQAPPAHHMPAFARTAPLGPPPSSIRTSNFRSSGHELPGQRSLQQSQHQDAGVYSRGSHEGNISGDEDDKMQQDRSNSGSDVGQSTRHDNGSGSHLGGPAPPPTLQQIQQQHEQQYSQSSLYGQQGQGSQSASMPAPSQGYPSQQSVTGGLPPPSSLQQLSQEALAHSQQPDLQQVSSQAAGNATPSSSAQPPVHPGSHGKVIRSNGGGGAGVGASMSPPGAAGSSMGDSPDKGRRTRVPQACDLCRSRKARCLHGRPAGANNPTDPGQRCARCTKQNRDCTWSFFSNDGRQATTAKKRTRLCNGDSDTESGAVAGPSSGRNASSSSKRSKHGGGASSSRASRGMMDSTAQSHENPYYADPQSQHSQALAVQLALQQRLREQGSQDQYGGQPVTMSVDTPSRRGGSGSYQSGRRIISDGVDRRRKRATRAVSRPVKSLRGRANMERRTRGRSMLEKNRRAKDKGKAAETSTSKADVDISRSFTGPRDYKMTRRHSIGTSALPDLAVLSYFEGNTSAKSTDQPSWYPFPSKTANRQNVIKQDEARPARSHEPKMPDGFLETELFYPNTPDSAPASAGDYGSLDDIEPLTLQDCRSLNPGRSHIRLANVLSSEPLDLLLTEMLTDAEVDAALRADGNLRVPFYPAGAPRSKSRRHRSSRRRAKRTFDRHVAHGQSRQIDLNALSQSQAAAGLLGINGSHDDDQPRVGTDSQIDSIFDMSAAAMASQQSQRALEDGIFRSQSSVQAPRQDNGETSHAGPSDPSYIVHLAQAGGDPPTGSQMWAKATDGSKFDPSLVGGSDFEYSALMENISELQKQHRQQSTSSPAAVAGPSTSSQSKPPRAALLVQIAISKEGRAKVADNGQVDQVVFPVFTKKGQKSEYDEEAGGMTDLLPLLSAGGRKGVRASEASLASMNQFAPQYQQQLQHHHTPQAVALAVACLPQLAGSSSTEGESQDAAMDTPSPTAATSAAPAAGGAPPMSQGIDILAEVSSSQREMPPPPPATTQGDQMQVDGP